MGASTSIFAAEWEYRTAAPRPAPASAEAMELCLVRTEVGDAELDRPVLGLSRIGRELLFVFEKSGSVRHCLAAVQGAALDDAMLLLKLGLVQEVSDGSAVDPAVLAKLQSVVHALLALPSYELYTVLTQESKRCLGLLQAFRMVLALERCDSQHAQRLLAVRFVREVWRTHGDSGIRPLQRLLLGP